MCGEDKKTGCCGGQGQCGCGDKDAQSGSCSSNCGCAGGEEGNPLDLSVEQIKKINDILGDIEDEDLETGNYDLTPEQAEELNNILFGKQA